MNIKNISKEEADKLIEKEESHFFDQKAKEISGDKVQKISVAFANTDGGEFCIGIKDKKDEPITENRWDGFDTMEEYNAILSNFLSISPCLEYKCCFLKCDSYKGYLLDIKIDKSLSVHQTSAKKIYIRQGAQSIPLQNLEQIDNLRYAKGTTSYENELVPHVKPEAIYESEILKSFLKNLSPQTDNLEFCFSENLIDENKCIPTVAGLLLFSTNPSSILSRKCAVKIARYETKDDDPDRDNLKYTITLEGPLYNLIKDTCDKISEIMSQIKVWGTNGKLKTMEYPQETIWEIVTNALIHRDYSISDDIRVLIYDNRIEVISPGKLPANITPDNILERRYARNAKIVRILNKYKDAPNKDIGEGLNTAFQKMKEWKLQSPRIIEENDCVCVIIPHIPLANASDLILQFLKNNNEITNKQARDITGIKSENQVKNEFYKLREGGYIERVPEKRGAASAWRLIK